MLALARKKGESIIINDEIEIVVLEAGKEQVKIGIKAPKEMKILRKEIYDRIQAENINANEIAASDIDVLKNMLKDMQKK